MKFINTNILLFGVIALIISGLFHSLLAHAIQDHNYTGIFITAIVYGLLLFFSGLLIGKRDVYEGYLGLNYHLITYLCCNGSAIILSTFGGLPDNYIKSTLITMLIWGVFLFMHFIIYLFLRKKAIKGYHKKEIFE